MRVFFLAFVLSLTFSAALSAQKMQSAREEATELSSYFGLDAGQQAEMMRIQERRYAQYAEIEPLLQTDAALYWQKRHAIFQGMETAVEQLLRPDQRPLMQQRRQERRLAESHYIDELRERGVPDNDIKRLLLERY